jgi:hypothetical protein
LLQERHQDEHYEQLFACKVRWGLSWTQAQYHALLVAAIAAHLPFIGAEEGGELGSGFAEVIDGSVSNLSSGLGADDAADGNGKAPVSASDGAGPAVLTREYTRRLPLPAKQQLLGLMQSYVDAAFDYIVAMLGDPLQCSDNFQSQLAGVNETLAAVLTVVDNIIHAFASPSSMGPALYYKFKYLDFASLCHLRRNEHAKALSLLREARTVWVAMAEYGHFGTGNAVSHPYQELSQLLARLAELECTPVHTGGRSAFPEDVELEEVPRPSPQYQAYYQGFLYAKQSLEYTAAAWLSDVHKTSLVHLVSQMETACFHAARVQNNDNNDNKKNTNHGIESGDTEGSATESFGEPVTFPSDCSDHKRPRYRPAQQCSDHELVGLWGSWVQSLLSSSSSSSSSTGISSRVLEALQGVLSIASNCATAAGAVALRIDYSSQTCDDFDRTHPKAPAGTSWLAQSDLCDAAVKSSSVAGLPEGTSPSPLPVKTKRVKLKKKVALHK